MENILPKGWVVVQLEELLASLEGGSTPKGGVRGIGNGIPSIGGEHLNDYGGFDFSNIKLRRIRQFYITFQIRDTLRPELKMN